MTSSESSNDIEGIFNTIIKATTVEDLDSSNNSPGPMDQLNNHLENLVYLSDIWKVVDVAKKRVASIRSLVDLREVEDILQNRRKKVVNWFGRLAEILARKYQLHAVATNILVDLWNELGYLQHDVFEGTGELKHVYRAGVGVYLGRIYMQREPGAAIWWLLHAHADDLLHQHGEGGGAARDMLRLAFGVGEDTFLYMKKCAEESLASAQLHSRYAEHLVMQLSLEPDFTHLFSHQTALIEFPIGRAYAATMLKRMKESSEGKTLEEFARYLMLLLAGWVPTENIYQRQTRIDSDLIARYIREPEAISTSHGRAILAECKNKKEPMGVSDVGYFLYRMHITQVKVGVLFAKGNISGHKSKRIRDTKEYAEQLLDLAFQRDDSVVIVLDLEDMRKLITAEKTVWSLIEGRIAKRRFGSRKQKNAP